MEEDCQTTETKGKEKNFKQEEEKKTYDFEQSNTKTNVWPFNKNLESRRQQNTFLKCWKKVVNLQFCTVCCKISFKNDEKDIFREQTLRNLLIRRPEL